MAISSFGRGEKGGNEPMANAAAGGGANLSAFIDQGSEFEGKLTFKDTVRIDGRFRGEISSENTLIVGESGEIDASIHSNTVAVSGAVTGNIHAEKKVVLHKTARVDGNIQTVCLAIEEGAVVNGQIKMITGQAKADSLKAIAGGAQKGGTQKNGGQPSDGGSSEKKS